MNTLNKNNLKSGMYSQICTFSSEQFNLMILSVNFNITGKYCLPTVNTTVILLIFSNLKIQPLTNIANKTGHQL